MIIVFTSLNHGGILQFAYSLVESLQKMNEKTMLFIPDDSMKIESVIDDTSIIKYRKDKRLVYSKKLKKQMVALVDKLCVDTIIAVDDGIISQVFLSSLNKKYSLAITIHDTTAHPQNFNLKSRMVESLKNKLRYLVFRNVDVIVLLSKYSQSIFAQNYPMYAKKTYLLPLGSHMPNVSERIPNELINKEYSEKNSFALFFGRVDKYKGIDRLIEIYSFAEKQGINLPDLIIAGKWIGQSYKEYVHNEKIVIIDRYIDDNEMNWLFANAMYVLLPLIEASQSGILPIAYQCGLPVITSNVPGLTQYIEQGETGIICNDIHDFINAITYLSENQEVREKMGKKAREYYFTHLEWINNLKGLLVALNNKKRNGKYQDE